MYSSALVLLPIVVGTVWFLPPVATLVLALVAAALAFVEYAAIAAALETRIPRLVSGAAVLAACAALGSGSIPIDVVLLTALITTGALAVGAGQPGPAVLRDAAAAVLPILYIGLPLGALAAKLMVAYRLHFETINLAAMELARRGELGDLEFFTSSFSMTVRRGDIRTKREYGGGTLYHIGVYCINAARNLFRMEPTEVSAVSFNSGLKSLAEIDETTAATLRFGDERVATFITSFNAADVAAYRIVGTKGQLHADPAYEYAEGLEYTVEIDGKKTTKRAGKRDQFAPELVLFRLHSPRHTAGVVR